MSAAMVDRAARNQYASLLRQLVAGCLVTDTFQSRAESIALDTQDLALQSLHVHADGLYHDLWPYRLRGKHRVSSAIRRRIARLVLFLRTDEEQIGQGPLIVPPDGPLTLVDAFAGFGAIVGALLLLNAWGLWGAALGMATIAAWLEIVHVRQARWQRRFDMAVEADGWWPFADKAALSQARRTRQFLTGI